MRSASLLWLLCRVFPLRKCGQRGLFPRVFQARAVWGLGAAGRFLTPSWGGGREPEHSARALTVSLQRKPSISTFTLRTVGAMKLLNREQQQVLRHISCISLSPFPCKKTLLIGPGSEWIGGSGTPCLQGVRNWTSRMGRRVGGDVEGRGGKVGQSAGRPQQGSSKHHSPVAGRMGTEPLQQARHGFRPFP